MLRNYLLIAVLILLTAGCKKDTKEILANQSLQLISDSPNPENLSICTGNTWTADLAAVAGDNAPVLVYNNKVYIFFSIDQGHISIYDGNTWTIKTTQNPWPGTDPNFYFAIGSKGYFGTLNHGFWEYDFETNIWIPRKLFPGQQRNGAATFTIDNKGYVVGGVSFQSGTYNNYDDTWQYDPSNNAWTQKASFPLLVFGRSYASGLSIGNKGYVVNGRFMSTTTSANFLFNSTLQYDAATNAWTMKANCPGEPRYASKAFVIGAFAYVGLGRHTSTNYSYNDMYKYNPTNDTWQAIPDFPVPFPRNTAFAINSRGYIGYSFDYNPDDLRLEKYTPLTCPIFNVDTQ